MENEEITTSPENEGLNSVEELRAELKRVRQEAASRRVENKEIKTQAQLDMEEAANKWREYEESQKSELQKLQDALAERDKTLAEIKKNNERNSIVKDIIKEFNLDPDDEELLTGSDEASLRKQADRLSKRVVKNSSNPLDLLAGNRGTPVGSSSDSSIDNMIRRSTRR